MLKRIYIIGISIGIALFLLGGCSTKANEHVQSDEQRQTAIDVLEDYLAHMKEGNVDKAVEHFSVHLDELHNFFGVYMYEYLETVSEERVPYDVLDLGTRLVESYERSDDYNVERSEDEGKAYIYKKDEIRNQYVFSFNMKISDPDGEKITVPVDFTVGWEHRDKFGNVIDGRFVIKNILVRSDLHEEKEDI